MGKNNSVREGPIWILVPPRASCIDSGDAAFDGVALISTDAFLAGMQKKYHYTSNNQYRKRERPTAPSGWAIKFFDLRLSTFCKGDRAATGHTAKDHKVTYRVAADTVAPVDAAGDLAAREKSGDDAATR